MLKCIRTNSDNADFQALVKLLDADLKVRDGDEHAFYNQFNKTDALKWVVVAYDNGALPVGCGAIKAYAEDTAEVKRMFVQPNQRGQGVASVVLRALEDWAAELSFEKCVLETGIRQPEAIRLYEKNGYRRTPNYGHYLHVENSVCFAKDLKKE